jgi:hypothetical protein
MQLPEKKYYTFQDAAKKLNCTVEDIKHYVMNRVIVPSLFLDAGNYALNVFEETFDENNFYTGLGLSGFEDFEDITPKFENSRTRGFHYLILPKQQSAHDCTYEYASEKPRGHGEGDLCYTLQSIYDLDYLENFGVVMAIELERLLNPSILKNAVPDKLPKPQGDKPLGNRERDTLLSIIAALCKEAKLDYEKPAKTAGLIQSTAAGMGISIGETTIENHLKRIPNALATRTR